METPTPPYVCLSEETVFLVWRFCSCHMIRTVYPHYRSALLGIACPISFHNFGCRLRLRRSCLCWQEEYHACFCHLYLPYFPVGLILHFFIDVFCGRIDVNNGQLDMFGEVPGRNSSFTHWNPVHQGSCFNFWHQNANSTPSLWLLSSLFSIPSCSQCVSLIPIWFLSGAVQCLHFCTVYLHSSFQCS